MVRIQPACSVCGEITATVELTHDEAGWRLDGTAITDERAALVTTAAELPYNEDRFWHAGLDEDCGFCIRCPAFYCKAHWKNGWCPKGHLMSLDFS